MKRILIAFICLIFLQSTNKAQTIIKTKKPGTLEQVLSQEQQDTCRYLAVEGNINSADVRLLRRMAGYKEDGFRTGKLHIIDLRKCTFITDKNPFMELDAKEELLAGAAFPKKIRWRSYGENTIGDYNVSSYVTGRIREPRKYTPIWFLQYCQFDSIALESNAQIIHRNGTYSEKKVASQGDYHFAKGITEEQWKEINKKYEIDQFPGHEIIQQGGRYVMKVHTEKGVFFHDTFYKCPNLKIVMLSEKIRTDSSIFDLSSEITYIKGVKVYEWEHGYSPRTLERLEYFNYYNL